MVTTVYIRIGALLPINPSPTTLCIGHSGFVIVSEYFSDDWCINANFKHSMSCSFGIFNLMKQVCKCLLTGKIIQR